MYLGCPSGLLLCWRSIARAAVSICVDACRSTHDVGRCGFATMAMCWVLARETVMTTIVDVAMSPTVVGVAVGINDGGVGIGACLSRGCGSSEVGTSELLLKRLDGCLNGSLDGCCHVVFLSSCSVGSKSMTGRCGDEETIHFVFGEMGLKGDVGLGNNVEFAPIGTCRGVHATTKDDVVAGVDGGDIVDFVAANGGEGTTILEALEEGFDWSRG